MTLGLPPGVRLGSVWGGRADGWTGTIAVANEAWNGRVPAAGSTTFGFQAAGPAGQGISLGCRPA